MSEIVAPVSEAAVAAFVEATGVPVEVVRAGFAAAAPFVTADTLRHTADQFEAVIDRVGHGNDPLFLLSALRLGADRVDPRVVEEEW